MTGTGDSYMGQGPARTLRSASRPISIELVCLTVVIMLTTM
jgi:hypothetical protein